MVPGGLDGGAGSHLNLLDYPGTQTDRVDGVTGRPILHACLHGADDRARQRWVFDKRRTTAAPRYAFRWATHVDVHTIKAKLAEHVGHMVKLVRIGAIDLRQDRSLALDKPQLAPG